MDSGAPKGLTVPVPLVYLNRLPVKVQILKHDAYIVVGNCCPDSEEDSDDSEDSEDSDDSEDSEDSDDSDDSEDSEDSEECKLCRFIDVGYLCALPVQSNLYFKGHAGDKNKLLDKTNDRLLNID